MSESRVTLVRDGNSDIKAGIDIFLKFLVNLGEKHIENPIS